jgi:hypothetical protein
MLKYNKMMIVDWVRLRGRGDEDKNI